MRHSLAGYRQRYDYEVAGAGWVEPLPGAEWADWDGDRGLTYADKGAIYGTTPTRAGLESPAELANFVADAPKPRRPPDWANTLVNDRRVCSLTASEPLTAISLCPWRGSRRRRPSA
jgi:hypothetical protein